MYRRLKQEGPIQSTLIQMRKKGVSPNLITYSLLMQFYGDIFDFVRCKELLNELHNEGIAPDTALYNSLMKYAKRASLVKRSDLISIEYIVDDMKKHEIKSDLNTYALAFDSLFKTEGTQEEKRVQANEIFEKLLAEGFTPNVHIFICLLKHALNAEDAFAIYEKMKSFHLRPTHHVFEMMLSVDLRKRKDGKLLDSLLRVVELMVEEGMKPNISQINVILSYCNKDYERSAAAYLIEFIDKHGIIPNSENIVAQMRIFPLHAEEIFLKAHANKDKIEFRPSVYHTLIETFVNLATAKKGKKSENTSKDEIIAKVKKYLRLMKEDGLKYDCQTYTLMITYYYSIGDTQEIAALTEKMEKRGLIYNFPCLKQLLKVHAMLRDYEMVEFYFKKFNSHDLKADVDVYCILIEFYTKTNQYDSAYEILDRIIQDKMKNTRASPKKIIRAFLTESRSSSSANRPHKVPFHELMKSCLDLGLI
jgi:pentatricopeptide repeat protein